MNFSDPYPDGGRVIWAVAVGKVVKIDPEDDKLRLIDEMDVPIDSIDGSDIGASLDLAANLFLDATNEHVAGAFANLAPPDIELREGESGRGTSGIYAVLGADGVFYQPLLHKIVAYGDGTEGDRFSPIEIKREFEVPAEMLPRAWDKIIGLVMTYDGRLAFTTNYGLVGVVTRDFQEAHYLQIGDGDEYVFNDIAADEDGGIYVVTHRRMYRVQWTGRELSLDEADAAWRAAYGTGNPNPLPVQSLAGSGSTPTLMGSGNQDKFVVITDGEQLMNIVLFWRDRIPADWEQIPGTESRRIAARVPVTFGDPSRERSFSDQSVLVRGYGAVVVNNELTEYADQSVVNIFTSGLPGTQPFGIEKFEWDPADRGLRSVWANRELSLPNAIPTMSEATGLIYSVGARDGIWTLEAADWDTGDSAFFLEIGDLARHNSAFAATQVGPDGTIYYGTFFGLQRIRP